MLYSVEVGRNIVDLRKLKGLSQEQLALESEISVSYLRDIEHGRANPSLDILETLSKTLEVSLLILFLWAKQDSEIQALIHQLKETSKVAG